MVSYPYALELTGDYSLPLLVDSGGFASLFKGSSIVTAGGLGVLEIVRGDGIERVHPRDVLDLQERVADIAFTLDFPIPPGTEPKEARLRQDLTIGNALWALDNRRRRDLLMFACLQGWDAESVRTAAQACAPSPFDGFAIGGLVPRARDHEMVLSMVEAVRDEIADRPLHVFGIGSPDLVEKLFERGVDSVDSSSYLKMAADGRLWGQSTFQVSDPTPFDRLHLALCNLAMAGGRALPLSASRLAFTTPALAQRQTRCGSA
jgi:tRNA-guanine family transglycosylase